MKEKILIVDDDKYISLLLHNYLEEEGFFCDTAGDGLEALEKVCKKNDYDMVLLDLMMPKMNGLEFLATVRDINPELLVMMISGYRTQENTLEALKLGAIGFIKKPFNLRDVLSNLKIVFNVSKSEKELGPMIPFVKKGSMEFVFKTGEIEPDKISFYLASHLGEMGFIEGRRISTVALAFNEVLINAIEHGTLALPVNYFTENLEGEDKETAVNLKNERLKDPQYAEKKIFIQYQFQNDEVAVTIIDEGSGFDTASITDCLISGDNLKAEGCGRGLMLMKYAVDEIRFNEKGNEVTLIIRA